MFPIYLFFQQDAGELESFILKQKFQKKFSNLLIFPTMWMPNSGMDLIFSNFVKVRNSLSKVFSLQEFILDFFY